MQNTLRQLYMARNMALSSKTLTAERGHQTSRMGVVIAHQLTAYESYIIISVAEP